MTRYDLTQLGPAFAARALDWADLGVLYTGPSEPTKTAKPASRITFEGPNHLGDLVLWTSGEASSGVLRLTDGRRMEKVYELQTRADLEAAIDELISFMRRGRFPGGGFLWDR